MSLIRFRCGRTRWVRPLSAVCLRRLSSAPSPATDPQYPPILEQGPLAEKLRRKKVWHDWLKSHETVEEKLFELNMPKYYGWNSVILRDNAVPYNFVPWSQFATRTHLEVGSEISPLYSDPTIDSTASELASQLKSEVEDIILFENEQFQRIHQFTLKNTKPKSEEEVKEIYTRSFIQHLNKVLLTTVVSSAKHLNLTTVVPDPRLDAFWFLGGINPSAEKRKERKARTKMTNRNVRASFLDPSLVDGPVNETIQFYGKPILQLQTRDPLPSAENLLENDERSQRVPHVPYEPHVMYLEKEYCRATTVPGFWPGEPHEFGILSIHSSNFLDRRSFGPEDNIDATHSVAMLSSFSWLLGQACYQGFSTFHDVTYPLLTQTAFSNGRDWSFYLYQLNTTLLHTKNSTENPRCNLCWGTKPMQLFQAIEGGRVIGLNEDVLKRIIKMYLLEPKERHGVDKKPYLSDKPHVADIDYEERRVWLESQYKFLTSNRPRVKPKPEVYAWEDIYKIKHNDMPREKRTKWYATQQPPPDCKRFDDHPRIHKPNALRTEEDLKLPRQVRMWKRTFYPGTNKDPLKPPPGK
ncbi:hypothetical protein ONE63_000592 [Megalurothrips usitatus]|uniref:39S ribosomal protein S30, mitochondrial n=1 Tax=Megalurothrips usitatus TaxID=439358 RepID=A0AAV7Y2U5_9NEOP|nr:hypothetical protein ONE63_000592 [Megalurothrips usitatus]